MRGQSGYSNAKVTSFIRNGNNVFIDGLCFNPYLLKIVVALFVVFNFFNNICKQISKPKHDLEIRKKCIVCVGNREMK